MPHIMAKFTKYIVRTFLVENPDTGQKYSFCNSGLDPKQNTIFTEVSNQHGKLFEWFYALKKANIWHMDFT